MSVSSGSKFDQPESVLAYRVPLLFIQNLVRYIESVISELAG